MAAQSKESLQTHPVQFKDTPLLEENCPTNPLELFQTWMSAAMESHPGDPNAMTLSTVRPDGQPVNRVVLLKEINADGLVFYTNYNSHKAEQIEKNPKACLLFYWHILGRQTRFEGELQKVPTAESDAYFETRPRDSQIGAYASPQSQIIPDRAFLDQKFAELSAEYGDDKIIPRPAHWGGYILKPELIEFWQGRASRLHDRIVYERSKSNWSIKRLAP